MQSPARWLRHTPMTEPGSVAPQFEELPSDIPSLGRITQGLLVHSEWLAAYGINPSAIPFVHRTTLPVRERLGALTKADGLALSQPRAPARRAAGTCRDFALTLCSFLRTTGTPARLRCGFAGYLTEAWEDHWVCEHWDKHDEEWRLSDPQLDEITRAACKVRFDPWNVPRNAFHTAGEAWLLCRAEDHDPERFGHGDTKGLWFMKVNVIRDSYALSNHEASPWDRWREAPQNLRTVDSNELTLLDDLAHHPEQLPGDLRPSWLV